jgi:FdhD protein
MNFTTTLLTGGRSSRMGRDKAMLDVDGEPLWQRQLRVLKTLQPAHSLISLRAGQSQISDDESTLVVDPPGTNDGPLTGIVGSLKQFNLPTLVLAVDMPDMTTEFLRTRLLDRFDNEHGLVFRGANGFEPLAALYTSAMIPLLEDALQQQRLALQPLIQRAIDSGFMQVIDMQPGDAIFFHNVNTPSDLEDKFAASVQHTRLHRDGRSEHVNDVTAREEPLEIRVGDRSIAVVMRTPGHDRELAAGFLVSEGVVQHSNQIVDIIKCDGQGRSKGNIVSAILADPDINLDSLTRHVFSTSSCGLCGKTSIDSVFQRFPAVQGDWRIEPSLLWSLPDKVRAAQNTFAKTGGLHACAIFDLNGELLVLREDVGRHNALDKILGYGLQRDLLPFDQHILFLSGRVSFEMMQKALAAGVPLVAAISAPSSLAVDFALESNQTLVGFLRDQSMNVYAHGTRVNGVV